MKTDKKDFIFPLLRRLILVFFVVVTFLLQCSFTFKNGGGLLLLLPLTVCISCFEKEFAGMFFGLLAGALWDTVSPLPDGIYALLFTVLATALGLLFHYLMRVTLLSVFVTAVPLTLLFTLGICVFNTLLSDFATFKALFLSVYLCPLLLSILYIPLAYFPVKYAEKRFAGR